jgi:probable HAF family extracellular repeat protein
MRLILLVLLSLLSLLLPPAALAAPSYSATFLPSNFQAFAIDAEGRIAGHGTDPNGNALAFVWSAGSIAFLPAPGPAPGGSSLVANALENGVAAGAWQSGGATRGFVYAGGAAQDVGTLYGGDTVVWGVNAAGQAVGESLDPAGNSRAFLYSGGAITTSAPWAARTRRRATSTTPALSSAAPSRGRHFPTTARMPSCIGTA